MDLQENLVNAKQTATAYYLNFELVSTTSESIGSRRLDRLGTGTPCQEQPHVVRLNLRY
jgi:hypothetical protein